MCRWTILADSEEVRGVANEHLVPGWGAPFDGCVFVVDHKAVERRSCFDYWPPTRRQARLGVPSTQSWRSDKQARQAVYATARNLACRWRKNLWQSAWGCATGETMPAMSWREFWNVQKIFQSVTTCHDEIVNSS